MSSSFHELLSPTFEPDTKQASSAGAGHNESEPGTSFHITTLLPFPRWPRILGTALNIFVLLGSISIIGVLAHSLHNYSGTRGIKFAGLNISWPKDLDLHPAYVVLAAASMSIGPSLASTIAAFRRLRVSSYSIIERILAVISGLLLVMWIAGVTLQGVSERTPKTDLLSWACRRRESPTNVLVSYTSICDEQVSGHLILSRLQD